MLNAYTDSHLPLNLESRWIRVFDLQPSYFGNEEEPIRGHLRVVCLDDNPSYVALSYTWGDPLHSRQIICGTNETLPVTTNCYDALQQLRHSSRTQTLWVDSICVNQSNEEEKSHEVSLMRDIYSQAQMVYIWLRKGNQDSDYAMDWLANATLGLSPLTLARIAPFPAFLRPRDAAKISRMLLEQIKLCKS
jgi:Heterokaryon incompatibility protein (HET)